MKKPFLKKLSILLVIILLLSLHPFSILATDALENPIETSSIFHQAYGAQVVEDVLYLLMEGELVSLEEKEEEPKTLLHFSDYPEINLYSALLFSDGSTLYLFDSATEFVYQLENTILQKLVKLQLYEEEDALEEGFQKPLLQSPFIQKGFLYTLYYNFTDHSKKIYRFSLENGAGTPIETRDHGFEEILPYKNDQILGFDFYTQTLMLIDPKTGSIINEIGTLKGISNGAVAYDFLEDRIYALCDGQLFQLQNKNPIPVDYLPPGSDQQDATYVGLWHKRYIFISQSTGLYSFGGEIRALENNPLTIWSEENNMIDSNILSDYKKVYPQSAFTLYNGGNENALEKISSTILTGDQGIDLFLVTSSSIDGKELFHRGYGYPLESSILREDVLLMYPKIQDYLMPNNTLIGFPIDLWPHYWTVYPQLLEEAQLGSIPDNLSDYHDIMLLWYQEHYANHPQVTFDGRQRAQAQLEDAIRTLTSYYVHTYASKEEPLSFNTPAFRAALEKIAPLSKWREEGDSSHDKISEKYIFTPTDSGPLFKSLNPEPLKKKYLSPLAFSQGEKPMIPTTLVYFIVNPHSQNKEEAIQFLEFYSQNMDFLRNYALHPNDNDLIETSKYEVLAETYHFNISTLKHQIANLTDPSQLADLNNLLAQEEAALNQLEKNRWEISPEDLAEYRKLAPYMVFDHRDLAHTINFQIDSTAILLKYFNKQATLDQVLAELDQRVSMMFWEMQ